MATAAAENVLIVGGGIAGLSAANALGQKGIRTTVVERAGGTVGASIGFTAQAVYALRDLGILDEVLALGHYYVVGEPMWWGRVYNGAGELQPAREPVYKDWTVPTSLSIQRSNLHEIMRAAAESHGADVRLGQTYKDFEQHDGGVEVELTTGETGTYDLMIAAEGVHSVTRDRVFPEVGQPNYTGAMSLRIQFHNAPDYWVDGLHIAEGVTIAANTCPPNPGEDGVIFYMGFGKVMEQRRIEQDEAREISLAQLSKFRAPWFDEARARLVDEQLPVLVAPYEWIYVPAPRHRGRIVLVGDTAQATAPALGSAGGMALEDGVVLADELTKTDDLEQALTSFAARREPRTRLVTETSVALMQTHQKDRPTPDVIAQQQAMRMRALQTLADPY